MCREELGFVFCLGRRICCFRRWSCRVKVEIERLLLGYFRVKVKGDGGLGLR